ncbi:hypothetical protein [Cryptosporangium japonicum]|uniref:Uncharacterized protein n=1 Tax=Cryptosporangium japonicum TaxID=80872 RepID=A0ABN0TG66_9ACTN
MATDPDSTTTTARAAPRARVASPHCSLFASSAGSSPDTRCCRRRADDGRPTLTASPPVEGAELHGLLPEVSPGDYKARYAAWRTPSGLRVTGELPFSVFAPAVTYLLFVALAADAVIAIMATSPPPLNPRHRLGNRLRHERCRATR